MAEARANFRSVWQVLLGFGAGVLLFALLLLKPPSGGVIEAVAASLSRGGKIEMAAPLAVNASTATNLPANIPLNFTNPASRSPTNATSVSVVESPKVFTVDGEKYHSISFGLLSSFRFKVTDEMSGPGANPFVATALTWEQIPAEVKAFNEKAVALTGFMLPVKWRDGLVTDFMLLPNQMGCCYGMMPRINDVVVVNTAGRGVKAVPDVPISVLGSFHAGALRSDNYLIGIYQIDCERIVEPRALNRR